MRAGVCRADLDQARADRLLLNLGPYEVPIYFSRRFSAAQFLPSNSHSGWLHNYLASEPFCSGTRRWCAASSPRTSDGAS